MELNSLELSSHVNRFLTTKEVQDLLQLSDESVHNLTKTGKLEFIQLSSKSFRYPCNQLFFKGAFAKGITELPKELPGQAYHPRPKVVGSRKGRRLKDLVGKN